MSQISTDTTLPALLNIGPVPADVLDKMIGEASGVQMHDSLDVPGVYFALLILPALKELRQLRCALARNGTNVVALNRATEGGENAPA